MPFYFHDTGEVFVSERIVLISGANGGLGGAVSERFLSAGDRVVGVARSAEGPKHPRYIGIGADLTSAEEVRATIADLIKSHGRIDVFLHLMGGFAGGKSAAETDDETWKRMLDLNLNAAFYLFREVLPPMTRAGKGRIVAIGSRAGVQPAANLSAYTVSKAALNALVQTVAAEVRNLGITANVLMPSVIDTEANRRGASAEEIAKWVKPGALAEYAYWLASDAAADINGALIPVYGRD